MQTRSLETLVRIHEVLSFSQAAELQNMTLSALSMQMKSLETELNAQLFDRTFRPPKLTPLGHEVALQAQKVLEQLRRLTDLCGAESDLSGRFRLGVVSSVAVRMIPQFISDFATSEPLARFDVTTGLSEDLFEQVRLGRLDGAVVTRVAQTWPELNFEHLRYEDMIYAVPEAHAAAALNDLAKTLPFIHFRPSSGIGHLIAEHVRDSDVSPNKTIILDSLEACMAFVKQGLGYTLLPEPDVRNLANETVHMVRDLPRRMYRELALVSRHESVNQRWNARILTVFSNI